MEKCPLFSVVTTCYNSEKTIRDTLNSMLGQRFVDYEYILIDAGSTDSTVAILEEYVEKFKGRMRYYSEKDEGIYDGMNKGIMKSQGKYVSILNSDDYYDQETLATVFSIIESRNDLPIIFGDICRVSKNKEPIYRYYFDISRVENNIPFGHPTMFLPKSIYEEIGLYDYKRYSLAADVEFQQRLYAVKEKYAWYVDDHVFTYMREGGATDNLKYLKKWATELSSIQVKYYGRNKLIAFVESFVSMGGRAIKNRMPYGIQRKMYNLYRNKTR